MFNFKQYLKFAAEELVEWEEGFFLEQFGLQTYIEAGQKSGTA